VHHYENPNAESLVARSRWVGDFHEPLDSTL